MNDNSINSTHQTQDDEIDLLELFHTLLNGKWLILFFAIISTTLAFIYAFGQTPTYKADALLQVESQKAAIPGIEELAGLGGEDASVSTEIELIKSRRNLGKAVTELKLDIVTQPTRLPLLGNLSKKFYSTNDIKKLPPVWNKIDDFLYPYAWGNETLVINRLEVPTNLLNEPLTLISESNSAFSLFYNEKLLLQGETGKPASSVDGSIRIYVRELHALDGTQFTVTKLSNLAAILALQKNIKASEKGKKTGIINLVMEGQDKKKIVQIIDHVANTYLQQNKSRSSEEASNALDFLEEQIKPVKEKADIAESRIKAYRTRNQTADISKETQAVLNVVSSIETELQRLSLKRDELSQKYTKNHPIIQSIASQERKLRSRKDKTLSQIKKLPVTQQELLKLERDYKVANTIYADLLNNIQEFKIAKASSLGNVYIIDNAVAHDKPIKPKKAMILALGALLGLMLGTLVVFLRKALHHTIVNPEKLEEALGIPVYATIPLTKDVNLTGGIRKDKRQKTLLAIEKPNDPAIESLRSLRTSLHFALLESKNNIVMITGPSPGIGKSFTSSNFAAVIATGEQRVLLIDADMRKGYLHNLLNKKVSPGLSDLISEKTSVEDAIHTIDIGNNSTLDIITRGQTPPNPSELLMHSRFENLLNRFSEEYDLILIDTPPIHAVTDPTIIGKHAGVTFMVVYHDRHNLKEIEYALTRLSHTGIETKGFIFNGYVAAANKGGYGYGYHSYYGDYKSDK